MPYSPTAAIRMKIHGMRRPYSEHLLRYSRTHTRTHVCGCVRRLWHTAPTSGANGGSTERHHTLSVIATVNPVRAIFKFPVDSSRAVDDPLAQSSSVTFQLSLFDIYLVDILGFAPILITFMARKGKFGPWIN